MTATLTDPGMDTDPAELTAPAALVDDYMRRFLEQSTLPGNLVEAIAYSLLGPGKRMRPILVIRACQAVGGAAEAALPPAAAIEMIHCFSLIHDDLPAMDNDDLRRGRPTLHRHTNEAMAILAGDAMMGLAFELLATRVNPPRLSAALLRELAAGTNAMIAGQVYDTLPDFAASVDAPTQLRTIHRHKTGALLKASVVMGAMAGGAKRRQLAALTRFGEAIGLMFQVVDDVLDVTQTTEQLGKTAGKDVNQAKLTYPAVFGLQESRRIVEDLRQQAIDALEGFGEEAGKLRRICDYLAIRTK